MHAAAGGLTLENPNAKPRRFPASVKSRTGEFSRTVIKIQTRRFSYGPIKREQVKRVFLLKWKNVVYTRYERLVVFDRGRCTYLFMSLFFLLCTFNMAYFGKSLKTIWQVNFATQTSFGIFLIGVIFLLSIFLGPLTGWTKKKNENTITYLKQMV